MGPFDATGCDVLAYAALFLLVWLVPNLMLSGAPSVNLARRQGRRIHLMGYAASLNRSLRSMRNVKGGPSRAA